jgi:hypothetical protein
MLALAPSVIFSNNTSINKTRSTISAERRPQQGLLDDNLSPSSVFFPLDRPGERLEGEDPITLPQKYEVVTNQVALAGEKASSLQKMAFGDREGEKAPSLQSWDSFLKNVWLRHVAVGGKFLADGLAFCKIAVVDVACVGAGIAHPFPTDVVVFAVVESGAEETVGQRDDGQLFFGLFGDLFALRRGQIDKLFLVLSLSLYIKEVDDKGEKRRRGKELVVG